jgi:poly(3-hydroxybutyrate) depolymerase
VGARRADARPAAVRHRLGDDRRREVAVREEVGRASPRSRPCCASRKIVDGTPQPRVLLVAPLSGHFATLLRGTVRTMLPEHDVYVDRLAQRARRRAVRSGRFGVDEYIEHIIDFLRTMGPGAHVVASASPA